MKTEELYRYFSECAFVATDTRKITPGSLFFALKGGNYDANAFAGEAIAKGAKYAVIDNPEYKTGDRMIIVQDSLTALQELARYHREQLGLPVIALTGSNGKTTTKELIHAVLSKKYRTTATVGNLNNHIGVPLTLLAFTKETEIGIVEMGANHQKEIEFLCTIANPSFGYITNFGKAHLEGFGGTEGVIKGKSELYDYLSKNNGTAFVNLDDAIQKEKTATLPRYTFSSDSYNCDIRIETIAADPMVTVEYDGKKILSNLLGNYNATNIKAAIAIGNFFKIDSDAVREAIEGYIPSNNRSQLMEKNTNSIILDAYNANPSSMAAAIENFKQLNAAGKIAILGDMFELGMESEAEHRAIAGLLEDLPEIETYFIGKDFYKNRKDSSHVHFFPDYESFTGYFQSIKPKRRTILIKGSRGMALERALDLL